MKYFSWIICMFKPCEKIVDETVYGIKFWHCKNCSNDNYRDRA